MGVRLRAFVNYCALKVKFTCLDRSILSEIIDRFDESAMDQSRFSRFKEKARPSTTGSRAGSSRNSIGIACQSSNQPC